MGFLCCSAWAAKESNSILSQSFSIPFPFYSPHWFGSVNWFSKESSLLLNHHIFAMSFNKETGFPDWVAYELNPGLLWGRLKAERSLKSDPLLVEAAKAAGFQPLTLNDYHDAAAFGYDKGHLAPKGSFKGSLFAFEAQYMTNIVPQKRDLNQGPWRILEEKIRQFVLKGNPVKVLAGPLYGGFAGGKKPYKKKLPVWPAAQGKITEVPSGFWKMVFVRSKSSLKACAVLMPQDLNGGGRKTNPKNFIATVKELQNYIPLRIQTLKSDCRFLRF